MVYEGEYRSLEHRLGNCSRELVPHPSRRRRAILPALGLAGAILGADAKPVEVF
jgi:hypothetical protein